MFVDLPAVSIERIIRPYNIKEEKLRKTLFPDEIKEITIFVPLIEEFFNKFPIPADCQKLVMLHMLSTIRQLLKKCNFDDQELFGLLLNYSSNILSMFPNFLSEIEEIDFMKDWKILNEKYKHDQAALEALEEVFYYIIYLQNSEPIIKKKTSKINEYLKREIIMQKTEFSKNLNDLLDTLFSVGINKPIDITVFLVLSCKLENKGGIICDDDIMDKLGLTREEYIESIKRLEKHKIIAARIPTDDELKDE